MLKEKTECDFLISILLLNRNSYSLQDEWIIPIHSGISIISGCYISLGMHANVMIGI